MSFRWCLPEERKTEEAFLFASAFRISLRKAGVERGESTFLKYVLPLLEGKRVHASVADNAIAFALLGEILQPEIGPGHLLPQHSPHWLAFRRLFLALCDEDIPEELLVELGGSVWDNMSEIEEAELAVVLGLGEAETEAFRVDPVSDSELPPKFELAHLREGYAKQIPVIRKITEIRLASYESVSLLRVKESLVEEGRVDLDPVCGALYEIGQNVATGAVPVSTSLPRPGETPTTLSLLAQMVAESGVDFDFETEYQEAARSVRGVLFDIATEMTVGKVVDPEIDPWELEQLFCERRIVEDPSTVLTDARIQFHLASGMGNNGAGFLRRIASMFETADEKGVRVRINPIKANLAAYWIDPQFPLWLMTFPAIENFLGMLGIDNDGYSLGETIREFTRAREGEADSPLVAASRRLITGVEWQLPRSSRLGLAFRKYLADAQAFPALQEHVRGLSLSDLDPTPGRE